VRVDILERLADLIRPALSWREGAPGPKPDGVFDGRGFLVTGAMTSLTGASGEDFASILRSLGYRMDRKPKPVEPATSATVAATSDVSVATQTSPAGEDAPASIEIVAAEVAAAEVVTSEVVATEPASGETSLAADAPSHSLLPGAEFVAAEAAPLVQELVPLAAQEPEASPAEAANAAPSPAAEVDPAESRPLEEAAFVEVWRPAGRFERRPHRPRRQQRPQQAQVAASEAAVAPVTSPAEGAAISASPEGAQPSHGPRRPRHEHADGPDREKRQDRHERHQRLERQDKREQQERSARRERPRRDRGERVDRAEREQYYAKPFGSTSGGRDKQPDPNSPFAKLAALKQQLEQSGKDPS
jgi:ATP-dependent RNA helicase SUPV3L1/SUV3